MVSQFFFSFHNSDSADHSADLGDASGTDGAHASDATSAANSSGRLPARSDAHAAAPHLLPAHALLVPESTRVPPDFLHPPWPVCHRNARPAV